MEELGKFTPQVHEVLNFVSNNDSVNLENELLDLLISLGPRGIMTIFGFRKTVGSQDLPWPSKKDLLQAFNRPNTILNDEELKRIKNPPKLTVGARALTKHAHRSSEGFWGEIKGTEIQKNQLASVLAEKILNECVWINVHTLPH